MWGPRLRDTENTNMFKRARGIRWSVLAAVLSLMAAGCDDSTGSLTDVTGATALSIFLKDGVAAKITGIVSIDLNVVLPLCGGEERNLEDFVPVAASTVLVDYEGNALIFTGKTDEGGFEIEVLGVDTYDLGYDAETDFGDQKLVWEAEVNPRQAAIETEGSEVDGVVYSVTGVSCVLVDPQGSLVDINSPPRHQ